MRRLTLIAAAGFSLLALGACGDDDVAERDAASAATASTGGAASGDAAPATVTCVAGGGGDVEVRIEDFAFTPSPQTVAPGGSVTFTNTDDFPHSVWSVDETADGERAWESVGPDRMARAPENL